MAGKTALVVDDSKSARFALRKYLETHGYAVEVADSADAAYAFLEQQRPDLIFMDHVMPGTDGFDALFHLKSDPKTVNLPVVICSSNEGETFVRQARARGAADVLQKPPSPEQLGRLLEKLAQLPPAARAPTARPAGKVSTIVQPETAIERAVMQAVRRALPTPQTAAAPAVTVSAVTPVSPPPTAPAPEALNTLRTELDARLGKLGAELFDGLAALKSQFAEFERREDLSEQERRTLRAMVREECDALRGDFQAQLSSLRAAINELAERAAPSRDEIAEIARQAAAEEAHAVAERSMLNAAARISDQLAQSILGALSRADTAASQPLDHAPDQRAAR